MQFNFRKNLFWLNDRITTNGIRRKYLSDIHDSFYHPSYAAAAATEKLEALLKQATLNTTFYQDYIDRDFQSFPVVNKAIIRNDYQSFISQRYERSSLNCTTTSGSTGTPFMAFRDKNKLFRHESDNVFFNQLAGVEIGFKLYYFRIWNNLVNKNRLKQFAQNIIPVNAGDFSSEYLGKLFRQFVSDHSNKGMLAYASTYEGINEYLKQSYQVPLNVKNFKGIVSMSEQLPIEVKQSLEFLLGTKVVSRYSNMENGFIAQQLPGLGEIYFINQGSFLVELLEFDSDKAVSKGEFGRIVITDYFNYAMPFIRYDTGDIGKFGEYDYQGTKLKVLTEVAGRKVDSIYNSEGKLISPHYVTNTMWKYSSNILQFQFIQKAEKYYVLKINGSLSESEKEKLGSDFKTFLGQNSELAFEFVNEIPILASGKRRKIIQEHYV